LKYQNFATGSGHILIPFIIGIGAGWGMDTKILLQRFWFIKKLAFDGFYPLLVVLKKIDFCCCLKIDCCLVKKKFMRWRKALM